MPAHIEQTVQAIAEFHAQHHRKATPVQLAVDRLTGLVGRPRFVGWLAGGILIWIAINVGLQVLGVRVPDPAPFAYLQDVGAALSLFITVLILVTQRRDDQLAELREQLTLELAILGEQKNAKIIALIEELRRDLPMVANRYDPEAEALSTPADPQAVLEAIQETHHEVMSEVLSGDADRPSATS